MPGMRHINHFFNVSIFHLKLVLFYFENSCCHNFHSKIVKIDQKYLLPPILAAISFFRTVLPKIWNFIVLAQTDFLYILVNVLGRLFVKLNVNEVCSFLFMNFNFAKTLENTCK